MSQLEDLSIPFPAAMIHENPTGFGSYVAHPLVTQRLLLHLGGYDFTVQHIIRGDTKAGQENVIVGVVCRLEVEIDGVRHAVDECGDCEQPGNWPHDGARLKDAMSDALKRCSMRIGLGLHLWCKPGEYVLREKLRPTTVDGQTGEVT